MKTANEIFYHYFSKRISDVRSPQFYAGVIYILKLKCGETSSKSVPYKMGTCEADAYFAGCDAGHLYYKWAIEELAE